jgi:hypothetical protein
MGSTHMPSRRRIGATPKLPAYPIAYDAGKALNAVGKSAGEYGFGAQWAGQGAPARGDRTDTGHDLALGQTPMTHDAPMAVGGS